MERLWHCSPSPRCPRSRCSAWRIARRRGWKRCRNRRSPLAWGDAHVDRVLPQLQRGDRRRRIERALAVLRLELATALPHKRVPGEVLVVAGRRFEEHAEAVGRGQLLGGFQQLIPGFGHVVLVETR